MSRRNIPMVVEELALDGQVSLGKCCKETLRGWVKDINKYLNKEKYDWRVTGRMENKSGIISISEV